MKIAITNARLAFPVLFKAESVQGGKPSFGASLLLDPKTQADLINSIQDTIKKVAVEKWGDKGEKTHADLKNKEKICLRDGNGKSEYAGFENMMYVSAGGPTKPLVLDRDKTPLTEEDGKPYGGCYVNASVEIWAQDNQFGKRINAQLRGVQFTKDGESFSGGAPASVDEFEELEATSESTDDIFG